MSGKPLGERVTRVEEWHVAHAEACEGHFVAIMEHLETLNGDVAANSRFRLQQQTVYWLIGGAWASVLIPLTAIAVAVLG